MTPLVVTAELVDGFCASDEWTPTLDGILAYWVMHERLGGEEFALRSAHTSEMTPVEGLPLAVERWRDWWWYQCSSPIYEEATRVRRYFHRRFDQHLAEVYAAESVRKVMTSAGPFKAARLTALERTTRRVAWYCVGDPEHIDRLLRRVTAIGAKVGAGYGRVRAWSIEPADSDETARFRRPVPVEFAAEHGLGGAVLHWGLRPPVRLPVNQTLCVMPERSAYVE